MKVIPPIAIGAPGTLTRAGSGTFIDYAGILRSAGNDVPRNNFNILNLSAPPTMLVEATAQNTIFRSQEFDHATWTKVGTCTVNPDQIASPDSTVSADLIQGIDIVGTGTIYQTCVITTAARFEPSVWLKQSATCTSGVLALAHPGGDAFGKWLINISQLSATTWVRLTRSHAAVTVVTEFTGQATNVGGMYFYKVSGATTLSFYAWGAQVELGTASTSYIATTTVAVTRAADVYTGSSGGVGFYRPSNGTYWDAAGALQTVGSHIPRYTYDPANLSNNPVQLLEQATTNLIPSPATLTTQNVTVVGATYTLSMYGLGTVTLSGTGTGVLVGTGATNRVSLTFTPTAGTLTLTVSGDIPILAQLELGTVATSYIVGSRSAEMFTGQGLQYCNVPEPDVGETAWVSAYGGTYAVGAVVQRSTTHRLYLCIQSNTGRTALPEADASYWTDNGPTNRYAALDLLRNSATSSAPSALTSIRYVFAPGQRINSVGFVGMQATEVVISQDIGSTNYYYRKIAMTTRVVQNWTDYFFGLFKFVKSWCQFDIPLQSNATLTITVTGNPIKISGIVIGTAQYIGGIQYNTVRSALNFSTVTRDAFGNATLVPRRSVPKTDQKLFVNSAYIVALLQLIDDLNAVPALWSGLDDWLDSDYFEAFLIMGVYKEFSISADHATVATVTLQLEEI